MPANTTLPDVEAFLAAFRGGVAAKRSDADEHDGSRYDVWGGVGAVLFTRLTSRARGNFLNCYFDTADETATDRIVASRYPGVVPRVARASGVGTVTLRRPTPDGGEGTLYEGTRIGFYGSGTAIPRFYSTTETRGVSGSDTTVTLAVEAYEPGTGQAVDATAPGDRMLLEDSVFDPTFAPVRLICAAGTEFEDNAPFKARVRRERLAQRIGYATAVVQAMVAAGAAEVALFASDFFGPALDFGLNRIYVADTSFNTPPALLTACRLKIFSCVTMGMAPQVLALQSRQLTVQLNVTLWTPLGATARDGLAADARGRILNYINQNPYVWNAEALGGAARDVSSDISDIAVVTSAVAPTVTTLFDAPVLTRWTLAENDISVVFS